VSLAALLQSFFVDRLSSQRRASPETIASYRDCLKLFLVFASGYLHKPVERLELAELDVTVVTAFLEHLETKRANTVRTRNARLAAIHSFYRYGVLSHPELAQTIARVLAVPQKRFTKTAISFLERHEVEALLAAPDTSSWIGRRDRTLLALAAESGLRVSELTALRSRDVVTGKTSYVTCEGKGRKRRSTPMTSATAKMIEGWRKELDPGPDDPLFPTSTGGPLGRSAIEHLVSKYAASASASCPSLSDKHVTPHVLRHTAWPSCRPARACL
jgi:site-specific recombinase XerD